MRSPLVRSQLPAPLSFVSADESEAEQIGHRARDTSVEAALGPQRGFDFSRVRLHAGTAAPVVQRSPKKGAGSKPAERAADKPSAPVDPEQQALDLLPEHTQNGDGNILVNGNSCVAASLLNAFIIWARLHPDPIQRNRRVVDALTGVISAIKQDLAKGLQKSNTVNDMLRQNRSQGAEGARTRAEATLQQIGQIRDELAASQKEITQAQYAIVADDIRGLYAQEQGGGVAVERESELRTAMGLKPNPSRNITDVRSLFGETIQSLQPGEIAQVGWYVEVTGRVKRERHVWLIGRLNADSWFWLDQGTRPATREVAPTLQELYGKINDRRYGLTEYASPDLDNPPRITVLGDAERTTNLEILSADTVLAAVDDSYFHSGSQIKIELFRRETQDYKTAEQEVLGLQKSGALILQTTYGRFDVYQTSAVSGTDVKAKEIDAGDSGKIGGRLVDSAFRKKYPHAWLFLVGNDGSKASRVIPVY